MEMLFLGTVSRGDGGSPNRAPHRYPVGERGPTCLVRRQHSILGACSPRECEATLRGTASSRLPGMSGRSNPVIGRLRT